MKKILFALVFLIAGIIAGFLTHPYLSTNKLHASPNDASSLIQNMVHPLNSFSKSFFSGGTSGITRSVAYNFFKDYHNSETPEGSEGCLKTEVNGEEEAIISVFLSDSLLLTPLRSMAEDTLNKTFVGLAGIPGYNATRNSNTIMWVAIIEELDGEGNRIYKYLLPDDANSANSSLIIDYVDLCPIYCPENADRLWNRDWEE